MEISEDALWLEKYSQYLSMVYELNNGAPGRFAAAYIYDIVIFSQDFNYLETVFKSLREIGL